MTRDLADAMGAFTHATGMGETEFEIGVFPFV